MHYDSARTTPIGLSRYAEEFLTAALAADEKLGMRPGYEIHAPAPVMYLVGHAIELSLKSFLTYDSQISLRTLGGKPYGHNLNKLFEKAFELGLDTIVQFEAGEIEAMKALNDLYSTRQLNYIVTGEKTFPIFGPVQSFADRLVQAVGLHVGYGRCLV